MRDGILVINAGSSSIKFSLYIANGDEKPLLSCKGQVEGINVSPHFVAKAPHGAVLNEQRWPDQPNLSHSALFKYMIDWIESQLGDAQLKAAGHRVVHGGSQYAQPLLIDDDLMVELEKLVPLAPLHQPHNLAPIRALKEVHPELLQVACFDTAFHRSNPWTSQSFALPRKITGEGVKRYGFHGLSYEYIARQLGQIAPAVARGKVVVCHLGSGASMCAISEGKSIASTMGFTALDGLPMGTRTGTLDAGVVLYLLQQKGMSAKEIEDMLYKQSGLIGVSGVSNDMRVLLESSEPHAAEAVELFVYRISRELGSLAAAMGGIDALVFTAGIGEHSPKVRSLVCEHAQWLGVTIDEDANKHNAQLISTIDSPVSIWVIPTDEEMMIAKHTREVLHSIKA
ncbi:acetate kinase [Paramagnetospirillum kuznetsovii]|uniref:Acetate kinase n=1 Tax=Paramagnetospirillum kuznetsovii TaxID=2053833 RepID=A0A364NVW0_9PROT|nr:acetate/propionate family kinase [Paramagnetospirillum kuznetsovii]RAU21196.1 acetate kinase [Paramagnetospirillum kuznetsovii]